MDNDPPKSRLKIHVNGQIKAPQIRLIDENGRQRGIFSIVSALKIAAERHLDLVLIAPTANPPICRLIDYKAYQAPKRKA